MQVDLQATGIKLWNKADGHDVFDTQTSILVPFENLAVPPLVTSASMQARIVRSSSASSMC